MNGVRQGRRSEKNRMRDRKAYIEGFGTLGPFATTLPEALERVIPIPIPIPIPDTIGTRIASIGQCGCWLLVDGGW